MFNEDLVRGKKGQCYVRNLMRKRNHYIKDVSDNYTIGFDFYVDDKKCQLKTDSIINTSGNLFLENYMDYSNGDSARGWLNTSKADYLFYLDEKNYNLYIYKLDEIREYVKTNKNTIPVRSLNDGYKRIFGYCLNKDAVRHQTIRKSEKE